MFKDQLKKLRFIRNMTQADLAEALKTEYNYPVSKATISQLENGKRNPSIELLQNLSKIFKCSVEYLLDIETKNSTARKMHYVMSVQELLVKLQHISIPYLLLS